jgi:hypothetical protein
MFEPTIDPEGVLSTTGAPGRSPERAPHESAPFRVARVEKITAPDGCDGQNWYCYVLDNGRSAITCQRCGTLKEVTAHATRCVDQINARANGIQSLWSPRGRKPAS